MRAKFSSLLSGDGLKAKALRGSAMTFLSFGGGQMLRLASNLLLTRILFPEAFGLMALVQVFITGLQMFSDVGLIPSIIKSKRGDDPLFLDTGWTLQIIRGIILGLAACALAVPAAQFYEQDMLRQLLPVVGLNAFIQGFISTSMATTNRHLTLGRLTVLELGSQLVATVVMIILAILMQSVWALIIGTVVGTICKVILSHTYLPGVRHRIRWEHAAFLELFHFGKYIFISSGLGFLISSGDRAILGKFITLSELAVYNIAFFLATVPLVLSRQFAARIMLPLYSERPPAASEENRRSLAKARYLLTAAMFSICLFMALIGDWVVLFLYDDNYMLAGPILVLLGLAILPGILVASYDNLLISVGNSKDFTLLLLFMATTQTLALYIGITRFGMIGAVTAPILAQLLAYPLLVWMIRRYKAWDPMHDLIFAGIAIAGASLVLWVNDTALARVLAILPH